MLKLALLMYDSCIEVGDLLILFQAGIVKGRR